MIWFKNVRNRCHAYQMSMFTRFYNLFMAFGDVFIIHNIVYHSLIKNQFRKKKMNFKVFNTSAVIKSLLNMISTLNNSMDV